MRCLFLIVLFNVFGGFGFAQPSHDQFNRALDLLASDGGRYGLFLNEVINDQLKSGKLDIVYTKLKSAEGRVTLGTIGSQDHKLLIKVSPDQSIEELALTIGHEYMHWTTQTYLDQMEKTHPALFASILNGDKLTIALNKNPGKTLTRDELRDLFHYVMFHFIDEANAYFFEQKLTGKRLRPKQWADFELAVHILEQKTDLKLPPLELALKAIVIVKKGMAPAETLLALTTDDNFEHYLQAHQQLPSNQGRLTFNRVHLPNPGTWHPSSSGSWNSSK